MKNYHNIVKQILTENPATRDDDMLLYGAFMARFMIIGTDESFYHVCQTAKSRGLPSYEGITRARRKIQEQEPSLRGTMRRRRMEEEEVYHDYYSRH